MVLFYIFMIIGLIIGAWIGYDSSYGEISDGVMGAFVGALFGVMIGIMVSCMVGYIGYNEEAQKIVSQKKYEMAANGHYTLDDGELNFGYIDKNGNFQAVNVDDNFNIAAAPIGEAPYVEIVRYESSNEALAACSFGAADKGTVYNIYIAVADANASTTE